MKHEKWKNDFKGSTIKHLYFKPLIVAFIITIGLIVLMKFVANDLINTPIVMLGAVVYYLAFIDAKIDMLKRTLDKESKYKNSTLLWLDSTDNNTQ